MLSFIYTFTSTLPLLLVANMQVSSAAIMLFLLHNNASSNAESVSEILSMMAETEDTKIHATSRTLKKAQRQEGRLLDEITEDKVDKKNEKADAGVLAQVGIPCVYSDGTQGIKCDGINACKTLVFNYGGSFLGDIEIDRIECGSCIGEYSCYGLSNTDVGEKSCIGSKSCDSARNTLIGNNSCIKDYACHSVNDAKIGNNSCIKDYACRYVDYAKIGNNSCDGNNSCRVVNDAEIGNNSCDGNNSCNSVDAKIGNNSCIKDYACRYVDYDVGQDSCNGYRSCHLILVRNLQISHIIITTLGYPSFAS